MTQKKNADLSVLDFVLSPTCRYIGVGIGVISLLLMIIIPMPNYVEGFGTITRADTRSDSMREGIPGPRRLKYWVTVEYQVDGTKREIDKFMYTSKPLYTGIDTTIFYDSKNPRDAHLYLPGFSIHGLLLLIFLLAGCATGGLFWWNAFVKRRKEENRIANQEARQTVLIPFLVSSNPNVLQVSCPKCENPIQYQMHLVGQKARCPNCQFVFALPRYSGS